MDDMVSLKMKVNSIRIRNAITDPKANPRMTDPTLDGRLEVWNTVEGPVKVLTYGFDDPEVKPLLVDIHGSGFTLGNAAMDDRFMHQFVYECGVKVVSIDYALAPENRFPVALEQCYAVIACAKENAEKIGIDPDRIMTMGHSAGGNFCCGIQLLDRYIGELGIEAVILDYPPVDICTNAYDKPLPEGCIPPEMASMFDDAYRDAADASNPLVSPIFATPEMLEGFPPTLLITASQDSLCTEAQEFAGKLEDTGTTVEKRHFEGVPHGFTHLIDQPEYCEEALDAWDLMKDFVRRHI